MVLVLTNVEDFVKRLSQNIKSIDSREFYAKKFNENTNVDKVAAMTEIGSPMTLGDNKYFMKIGYEIFDTLMGHHLCTTKSLIQVLTETNNPKLVEKVFQQLEMKDPEFVGMKMFPVEWIIEVYKDDC